MRFSCLHTNADNISYYEAAVPPGVTLTHFLRPELCMRTDTSSAAEGLAAEVGAQVQRMRDGADAVLIASTMLSPYAVPPAVSADALLVEAIRRRGAGQWVEVLHINPLSEALIQRLYGAIPGTAGVSITALPDAWEAIRRGDRDGHAELVRQAIDRSPADLVALVHPAMAPMARHDTRVLSAVHVALRALLEPAPGGLQPETVG